MHSRFITFGLAALAVLITGLVFINAVHNGITNWDDPDYLTNNPLLDWRKTPLRAYFTTVISGNRHPLTMLSLSLDHALGDTSLGQYHQTNLLLHLLNVGLVFGLCWQWSGGSRLVAFLVALWFGIHPMHVESVAWISARKDVLYTAFFLLSLISYWRFLDHKAWSYLVLSLLAGVLANLAKPAAVILPVVLVLITFWHDNKLTVKAMLPTIPFFMVSVIVGWLTLASQASAAAINEHYSGWERIQLGGYALVNYVAKAVWPVGLSALYGRPGAGAAFPWFFLAATVVSVVGLTLLGWLYGRQVRLAPKSDAACWFFGGAFFVVNLALTLQLIKAVGSAAYADRYTYVAYIGLFFAVAMTIQRLRRPSLRLAAVSMAAVFSVTFAGLSFTRVGIWKNAETLWTDVLKTGPFSATAYSNRGLFYEQNDRLEDALADYSMAVANDPRIVFRANRAYLLSKLNRPDEAVADADFLLRENPDNALALTIKGTALVGKNQPAAAIPLLTRSLKIDSTYLNTWVNLGSAYFTNKQYPEAIRHYQKAGLLDGQNPVLWTNLGAAFLQNKQYTDAIAACQRAISLNPANGQAQLYACYAYQKTGNIAEAKASAQQAQKLGQVVDAGMLQAMGL
ncbi:tetratricopeptide repeat protein [Fibrella sp. HMF5335]|uniref:Tetratricopeptide repeat protein n=1 Tax=Fibrella rubiginis TaxID=2817060 RepID=A0A939GDA8_9BACT|nr:tetratricopeptide repeat protein [Fibrella rubiginis]MBO0936859.1 tetratricopeptide repeat protein [Fibrella rubiginis]